MKSKYIQISAERIKLIMKQSHMTSRDFCGKYGVAHASLYKWMNDGRIPRDVFEKINIPQVDENGTIILPRGFGQ